MQCLRGLKPLTEEKPARQLEHGLLCSPSYETSADRCTLGIWLETIRKSESLKYYKIPKSEVFPNYLEISLVVSLIFFSFLLCFFCYCFATSRNKIILVWQFLGGVAASSPSSALVVLHGRVFSAQHPDRVSWRRRSSDCGPLTHYDWCHMLLPFSFQSSSIRSAPFTGGAKLWPQMLLLCSRTCFLSEGWIIVFPRRVLEEVVWGARGVCHILPGILDIELHPRLASVWSSLKSSHPPPRNTRC